jgi:hypothetical protein
MAYQVKNTAGTVIATVSDNHVDKEATSVALVGYKATKYGLDTAENFVHLLEHFANSVSPDNPIKGQLWYDTATNSLKVYNGSRWGSISGSPSINGDYTQGGVSGVYHCSIPMDATSVLLLFAGGKIVAVVASKDIEQTHLPPGVQIEATEYPLQSVFPFGLQAGVNLSDVDSENNAVDFVFSGRVPLAEQAHFAGGGVNSTEVSGWGYMDLGPGRSVGLMISNGNVVAAVSSTYVLIGDMPNSISFYVKRDRDTGTGSTNFSGEYTGLDPHQIKVTIDNLREKFPGKTMNDYSVDGAGNPIVTGTTPNVSLFPGMTFASIAGVDLGKTGSIGQTMFALVASATSAYGTGLASAIDSVKVWVDNNSATSQKVTALVSEFTTATGTTSVAAAVQQIVSRASDTGAVAVAITDLKTSFQNALGVGSFAEALTKLRSSSDAAGANSESLTQLTSQFTNTTGQPTLASAVQTLWTKANETQTVAGYGISLNSNGYVTGVEAFNGGASNNYFKVTASRFIIGDNNIDFIPFEIRDGTVYMKNVVAENITYGSLIPAFGNGNNRLDINAGYQILPGGFIMQWGRVRRLIRDEQTFSVSFPMQFPNAVMAVTAMPFIAYFNERRDLWMQNTGEPSVFGCSFSTQSSTSNSQQIDGFDWMAYGY